MATTFKSSVEIDGYLSLTSGNWVQIPDGTTAQRPGSPTVGMFRYNTSTDEFEGYFGSTPAWGAIGGGGGNTYDLNATQDGNNVDLNLTSGDGSDNSTVQLTAGDNVTLTRNGAQEVTIAASGGTVTIEKNDFTGDGTDTTFDASSTIANENNIQIYIDGVYQSKDTYSTSGTTVTFSTAPPTGSSIEFMHYTTVTGVIDVDNFTGKSDKDILPNRDPN